MYFRVVTRYAKSQQDAQEIVADIALRVFESIGSFKGYSRFTTWLHTLIRSAAADYYRSSKNRTIHCDVPLSDIDDQWVRSDGNLKKEEATPWSEEGGRPVRPVVRPDDKELNKQISAEREKRFHLALKKLPMDHYRVMMCRGIKGLALKETAEELDRSEAAVKMLFSRARESLEKILSEDPYFSTRGGEKIESQS